MSSGSPGSPSSSPPMSHRGKMDENSNTDRHADSVSPSSMDSNHHEEERASKSKSNFSVETSDYILKCFSLFVDEFSWDYKSEEIKETILIFRVALLTIDD